MKFIKLLYFLGLLVSFSATAQQEPSPEEETFFTNAMTQIKAKHVRWIKSTASEANQKNLTAEDVKTKAGSYGVLGSISGADIEALAFLVLMQASKSAQEDLKAIMAQVKSINDQKEKLRSALAALKDKERTFTRVQLDSFRLLLKDPPSAQHLKPVSSRLAVTPAELEDLKTDLNLNLDSHTKNGEMLSLRLQMMMDRRNKFISTLSNLMKKISRTQDSIIANLK